MLASAKLQLEDKNYSQAEKADYVLYALEINASISGQTRSTQSRRKTIFLSENSQMSLLFQRSHILKGLVKKGDYIDRKKDRYYIYYEYSKSDHLNNIEDAKQRAISLVRQYSSFEKKNNSKASKARQCC